MVFVVVIEMKNIYYGIAVFYSDSFPVASVQEGVRRLQVNLRIKEWRC